ncbi:MAG: hypothetical protein ACI8ZB_003138 [Desulforhopalus sp.]
MASYQFSIDSENSRGYMSNYKENSKMKFTLFIFLLAFTLNGCAITSSHQSGPNGRPVHFIDGMTASAAYSKANQLCPRGYAILGNPEQQTPFDYVMTIECK